MDIQIMLANLQIISPYQITVQNLLSLILSSKGFQPQRLSAKGFGETKPVADNKTEEGRAKNRRTEMKVISQ